MENDPHHVGLNWESIYRGHLAVSMKIIIACTFWCNASTSGSLFCSYIVLACAWNYIYTKLLIVKVAKDEK